MRRALLDVNVLLALLDSDHVDHDHARDWLHDEISAGWASCAITENGVVRVLSRPRYPSPVPQTEAIDLLSRRWRRRMTGASSRSTAPCPWRRCAARPTTT